MTRFSVTVYYYLLRIPVLKKMEGRSGKKEYARKPFPFSS